jgi:hypothetical protein
MKETPTTPPVPDSFPHPLRTVVVGDSVLLLERLCAFYRVRVLCQLVGTALTDYHQVVGDIFYSRMASERAGL